MKAATGTDGQISSRSEPCDTCAYTKQSILPEAEGKWYIFCDSQLYPTCTLCFPASSHSIRASVVAHELQIRLEMGQCHVYRTETERTAALGGLATPPRLVMTVSNLIPITDSLKVAHTFSGHDVKKNVYLPAAAHASDSFSKSNSSPVGV